MPYKNGKAIAREMSDTLDFLLGPRYNKRLRPGFGKGPVMVELNMSIRSMGPVDENTQVSKHCVNYQIGLYRVTLNRCENY